MSDTRAGVARRVLAHHRAMSPTERCQAAASLFETARAIVESSLPAELTREEKRLRVARRIYNEELPEAALRAHANYAERE
jgi:orotidine-5'-phosphate decarboxylase